MESPRWSFVGVDWGKIGRGALVAIAGAILTYGTQVVADTDFGSWTPMVAAGWAIVVNLLRKFATEYR